MVPFDSQGGWYTSGVRLGTAALTTLGMGQSEMDEVADIIALILRNTAPKLVEKTGQPSKAKGETEKKALESARKRVAELLSGFPLYPELTIK